MNNLLCKVITEPVLESDEKGHFCRTLNGLFQQALTPGCFFLLLQVGEQSKPE